VAEASTPAIARDEPAARPAPSRATGRWAWLGLVPFLLFSVAFLFLPVAFLVVGSFTTSRGELTLANYAGLSDDYLVTAYVHSIQISAVTAIGGGLFGLLLAYAVILGGLPRFLRTGLMTFSGVASNFAGVPLALAFVFTLGNAGLATVFLRDTFDLNLRRDLGFNLYSIAGLSVTYMYFQFPLMVLIIAPAIDGLRKEWREASDNLGASSRQYWRHVALPILTPAILGTMILLFGNAFGAQATAFQLTGGSFPLATLVISAQIRGDVLHNPGLGYAMAMGMVVIMGVSIFAYTWLQRRAERWLRS
jgi:putative spermidine/putrescine transport system permease protein